jgi:hypothetical protein
VERGICKLCLLEKDLLDSHFLPAATYKSLLQPKMQNPHPYFMSPTKTVETSRQIKDYVLCGECEQRFNENGERWVLSQIARDGGFPLQETLRLATPIQSMGPLKIYGAGAIPKIDVDKLEYFALSVFWRGAVHDWKTFFGATYERLQLGPYRESLRQYLLGGPFPRNVETVISVCEEEEFASAMFPPTAGERNQEGRAYSFLIPGIQFSMAMGKRLKPETSEFNSHRMPERRIVMTPGVNEQFLQLRAKLASRQKRHQRT